MSSMNAEPPMISVQFRHMDTSPAVRAHALDLAQRLCRLNRSLSQVQISIERHHGHSPHATVSVKVHATLPGAQLHAHQPSHVNEPIDVYVALRRVFGDLRRQLYDLSQRQLHKSSDLTVVNP